MSQAVEQALDLIRENQPESFITKPRKARSFWFRSSFLRDLRASVVNFHSYRERASTGLFSRIGKSPTSPQNSRNGAPRHCVYPCGPDVIGPWGPKAPTENDMISASVTLTQPLSTHRQFVATSGTGHHFL